MLLSSTAYAELCPRGKDKFHSYLSIELNKEISLEKINIAESISRIFNEMAFNGCDYDHRDIRLAQVESTQVNNNNDDDKSTMQISVKALVHYKGMTGAPPQIFKKPTSIPTLFGPITFRNQYVEEECKCEKEGVDSTGVTVATFQSALEMALNSPVNKGIKVNSVKEVAVSSVKSEVV